MNPNDLVIIGFDTKDGPEHPLYDPRVNLPIDDAMLANIKLLGVVEPVVVWKQNGHTYVVDGRRRVMHARKAKLESVPTVTTNHENLDSVAISLNEIRKNTNPLDKAERMFSFIETRAPRDEEGNQEDKAYATAKKQCATVFGLSEKQVGNYLALLDCSARVKKAVDEGKLSPTAASKLAKLEKSEQDAELDKMLSSGKRATVKKAQQAAGKSRGKFVAGKREVRKVIGAWYDAVYQKNKEATEKLDPKLVEMVKEVDLNNDFWWGLDVATGGIDPDEVDESGALKKLLKYAAK